MESTHGKSMLSGHPSSSGSLGFRLVGVLINKGIYFWRFRFVWFQQGDPCWGPDYSGLVFRV